MDLERGGIWWEKVFYLHQSFYEKEHGALHLMISGVFGPNEFKTPLIYFEDHVNTTTYIKALEEYA